MAINKNAQSIRFWTDSTWIEYNKITYIHACSKHSYFVWILVCTACETLSQYQQTRECYTTALVYYCWNWVAEYPFDWLVANKARYERHAKGYLRSLLTNKAVSSVTTQIPGHWVFWKWMEECLLWKTRFQDILNCQIPWWYGVTKHQKSKYPDIFG